MDVAFVADKGGVGKTTLAYHVATRLRQLGQDAALLDLDRRSAAVWWSRQQGSPYVPAYALSELSDIPEHSVRIWDTPAHISGDAQDRLTGLCDLIITVTTPDALSVIAAGELSQSLIRRGGRVAVVLNNVHPTAHDRTLEAFDGTGAVTFATVIRRYSCYQQAQWDGQAVCDAAYSSADNAWTDISALTTEILSLVEVTDAV